MPWKKKRTKKPELSQNNVPVAAKMPDREGSKHYRNMRKNTARI